MQSFIILKQVVHTEPLGFQGLVAEFGTSGAEHWFLLLRKVRQSVDIL
jgi:hypothetical protein